MINGAIMHSGVPRFLSDQRKSILSNLTKNILAKEISNITDSVFGQLINVPAKTLLQSFQQIPGPKSEVGSVNHLDGEFFGTNPMKKLRDNSFAISSNITILLSSNSFEGKVQLNHLIRYLFFDTLIVDGFVVDINLGTLKAVFSPQVTHY